MYVCIKETLSSRHLDTGKTLCNAIPYKEQKALRQRFLLNFINQTDLISEHFGGSPLHLPVGRHALSSSPTREWLRSQVYLTKDPMWAVPLTKWTVPDLGRRILSHAQVLSLCASYNQELFIKMAIVVFWHTFNICEGVFFFLAFEAPRSIPSLEETRVYFLPNDTFAGK